MIVFALPLSLPSSFPLPLPLTPFPLTPLPPPDLLDLLCLNSAYYYHASQRSPIPAPTSTSVFNRIHWLTMFTTSLRS